MEQSLIIVNVFKGIIQKVDDALFSVLKKHLNYQHGSTDQMLEQLALQSQSPTMKNERFPMIALFQPFKEKMGGDYYATVKFPKIVIAVNTNATDNTDKRYAKTFVPVLYPIYEELLNQIRLCPNVVVQNQDYIPHIKMDNPGSPPPEQKSKQFNEYVDAIEIYDLELIFSVNNFCKRN